MMINIKFTNDDLLGKYVCKIKKILSWKNDGDKIMKRIVMFATIMFFLFSLSSCGDNENDSSNETKEAVDKMIDGGQETVDKILDNQQDVANDIKGGVEKIFNHDIIAISTSASHSVQLLANGKVEAFGNNEFGECDTEDWTDIVAIEAGALGTYGVRKDGTVVYTGDDEYNLDCSEWTDIVKVKEDKGNSCLIGLKSDGTVTYAQDGVSFYDETMEKLDSWTDIKDVAVSSDLVIGVKKDGTIVSAFDEYLNQNGIFDEFNNWNDIKSVSVSPGEFQILGLKTNGTVVAVGENNFGECNVEDWTDIIAVETGAGYSVGLRSNGTLVTAGEGYLGSLDVGEWKDIVAISSIGHVTLGLQSNGNVLATGDNELGACDIDDDYEMMYDEDEMSYGEDE